jgi:hypothetical protein
MKTPSFLVEEAIAMSINVEKPSLALLQLR